MDREYGPIEQLRVARRNPVASLLGAAAGGFVPIATYTMAHQQLLTGSWAESSTRVIVAGGLLYSAKTVWQWGRLTFEDRWKATGFVLLIEGVMMFSPVVWLARTALLYLLAINAIATACLLALRDQADAAGELTQHDEMEPPGSGRPPPDTTKLLTGSLGRRMRGSARRANTAAAEVLYDRAVRFVRAMPLGECSISAVQRHLAVGYNKAAAQVERMEREGIVGPAQPGGGRRLVKRAQIEVTSASRTPSAVRQLSRVEEGLS